MIKEGRLFIRCLCAENCEGASTSRSLDNGVTAFLLCGTDVVEVTFQIAFPEHAVVVGNLLYSERKSTSFCDLSEGIVHFLKRIAFQPFKI